MEEDRHVAARNPPLIISCFVVFPPSGWPLGCDLLFVSGGRGGERKLLRNDQNCKGVEYIDK